MDLINAPIEDENASGFFAQDSTSQAKKKPDFKRREILSKPPIRRLLASGLHAVKTGNEKVLGNLENMLCCPLRDTIHPSMAEREWRDYINKFMDAYNPKHPERADKVTWDCLQYPVYYEPYQRYRSYLLQKFRMYRFGCSAKPRAKGSSVSSQKQNSPSVQHHRFENQTQIKTMSHEALPQTTQFTTFAQNYCHNGALSPKCSQSEISEQTKTTTQPMQHQFITVQRCTLHERNLETKTLPRGKIHHAVQTSSPQVKRLHYILCPLNSENSQQNFKSDAAPKMMQHKNGPYSKLRPSTLGRKTFPQNIQYQSFPLQYSNCVQSSFQGEPLPQTVQANTEPQTGQHQNCIQSKILMQSDRRLLLPVQSLACDREPDNTEVKNCLLRESSSESSYCTTSASIEGEIRFENKTMPSPKTYRSVGIQCNDQCRFIMQKNDSHHRIHVVR